MTENQIQSTPKFEGVEVKIGGTVYTVPPLSLRQVKSLQSTLAEFRSLTADGFDVAMFDKVLLVVQTALSRNYPDITLDALADMLDLTNSIVVLNAVMGASGLLSSGNTTSPNQTSRPIGT